MGVFMKKVSIMYEDFLKEKTKQDIIDYLNFFNIKYRHNGSKDNLERILFNSLEEIVRYSFNLFQNDELANIKLVIKNSGYVKIKANYLLQYFMNNLARFGLVKIISETEYLMPKEVVRYFKLCLKDKQILKNVKQNTKEYNLLLGIINTYGVLTFEKFYTIYSKSFEYKKTELYDKLLILQKFYLEFNILNDKNNKYICNNYFEKLKEVKKYIKKKAEYKEFTQKELVNIYNFKYMCKFKPYKKLLSFVKKNYYLNEKDIKVFHKYVIIPYLNDIQIGCTGAEENLSINIDKYFEYKNEKHKGKFMELIKEIINYYPMWKYYGFSQMEVKCEK